MKKTFSLKSAHDDPRALEAIRLEVRKYVKRERRKTCPEGVDFWTFACKVGPDSATAEPISLDEVIPAIETAAADPDRMAVYVEILATPGVRPKRQIADSAPPVAD